MPTVAELPPLEEAAGPAAVTAAVMSEVARTSYTDSAMVAFADANRQFGTAPPFNDPGHFVRDVVGSYLISAGDFVCGLQYVTAPDHGLTFSSASLARSACEFANKASWVAADDLSTGQRIARALAILKDALKEEKALLDEDGLTGLAEATDDLDRWAAQVSLPAVDGAFSARALFKAVNLEQGARDYKRLSNAAHGSLISTIVSRRAVTIGSPEHVAEGWWRVLAACMYGYRAAVQVCALQGQPQPENMLKAGEVLDYYLGIYNQSWAAA